jgi:apolipoprotein D and lipocalin family protein
LLVAVAGAALGAEPSAAPLETVADLDLARYEGRWYEVVRKPNRFQKACAGDVLVQYTRRPDGRIEVFNQCSEADGDIRSVTGVARRPDPDGYPARLEVRFAPAFLSFIPAVWADYWVIDLDPGYRWAAVGEPDRKYFWVLSRTPGLPADTLDSILERAKLQGYDLSDLVRTRHGQPLSE